MECMAPNYWMTSVNLLRMSISIVPNCTFTINCLMNYWTIPAVKSIAFMVLLSITTDALADKFTRTEAFEKCILQIWFASAFPKNISHLHVIMHMSKYRKQQQWRVKRFRSPRYRNSSKTQRKYVPFAYKYTQARARSNHHLSSSFTNEMHIHMCL